MHESEPDASPHQPVDQDADRSWPERNVNLLIGGLIAACVASLIAEPVFSPFFDDHHPPHFQLENVFGYQAVLGFVAFVTVVFLGKLLRVFVSRPEDYYDQ